MKLIFLASIFLGSLAAEEVPIVREHLLQRAPEWNPKIVETYANGSAKGIYFYQEGVDGEEVAIKRVLLSEKGGVLVEEDLLGDKQHGLSVNYYPDGKVKEIVCYANGIKQGPHKEFYQNGPLKSEEIFDQGLLCGKKTTFYEDGTKEFECEFRQGKLEGDALSFYSSGKRKSIVSYVNGLKEAVATEWHENGVVRIKVGYLADKENDYGNNPALVAYDELGAIFSVRHFDKGVPVGSHVVYHPNGREADKVSYKDGKMHGAAKAFSLTGDLIGETTYKDGNRIGKSWLKYENGHYKFYAEYNEKGELLKPIKEYAENGKEIAEYSLKNEKLDGRLRKWSDKGVLLVDYIYQQGIFAGPQKEWYENGNQYKSYTYNKEGKLTGNGTEWHQNGVKALEANYLDGRIEGEITEWYDNGKLKSKRIYKEGEPSGLHQTWYENGVEKERANFQKGLITGTHNQWNEKGELILEETFDNKGKAKGTLKAFYGKGLPKEIVEVSHGARHGKTVEYHENGQVKLKANYQNDKPEGIVEGWFDDGNLAFTKMYKDGKQVGEQKEFFEKKQGLLRVCYHNSKGEMDGEQKMFYPDGKIQSIMTYKDGILHGKKALYNQEAEIIEEGYYDQGKLHGILRQVDQNGREVVCTYVKNKKEGPYEVYYPLHPKHGKVKALEAVYVNGQIEGEVLEYSEAGHKIAQSQFVNGKKEGEATLFTEKGQVLAKMYFTNDKQNGETTQYYPDGKIHKVTHFVNQEINGEEKTFYRNGKLSSLVSYKYGKQDGPSQSWNEDGVLVYEGEFKDGKKDGKINKYYDSGKPRLLQIYKDDTLVSKESLK
jgi:antitoxin component YwqK of YwqJK toxin-antitoxin module